MADDAARLKIISDNVQALWESMQRAASTISGLLQVGRATCEEVKAYNLWTLACYATQQGMLATLRANGEQGVPELPPTPTWFGWRGVPGERAIELDCGKETSLSGAMKAALRGPTETTRYLSLNEVEIHQGDVIPSGGRPFAVLAQQAGLGLAPLVWIVIATITVGVGIALQAIMSYLETSEVQESNSRQVAMQADAYANYLDARLSCYKQCTSEGKSTPDCVSICAKLVDKPNITLPGQMAKWGWLQWTGFTVVAGVGAMIVYKAWQRKREGKSIFQLPDPL